jgi:hypothetical protein
MEQNNFVKRIRGVNTYINVIDTQFTEFITTQPEEPQDPVTVDEFFTYYDLLFFDIPLTGENSHSTLIERSQQYLGGRVADPEKQALIEEINDLRQQILSLSQTYLSIGEVTQ